MTRLRGLGWRLGICISNKTPDDAEAASRGRRRGGGGGGEPHFENVCIRVFGPNSLQNQLPLWRRAGLQQVHRRLVLGRWRAVQVVAPTYTPFSSAWEFLVLRIVTKTWYFQTYTFLPAWQVYNRISLWFPLVFPKLLMGLCTFSYPYWPFPVFLLCKVPIQVLWPFFLLGYLFFFFFFFFGW